MLRHARQLGNADRLRLAVSSRTLAELPYAGDLVAHSALIALTREATSGGRPRGRLTAAELHTLLVASDPTGYICGSATFAEAATTLLVEAGLPAEEIRVERFGPTG